MEKVLQMPQFLRKSFKWTIAIVLWLSCVLNIGAQSTNTYTVTVKYSTGGANTFPQVVSPNGQVIGTATVYLVGAGGAGGSGTSSNYGAGGGGGGASTTATGYDIVNYAIPFTVATGGTTSGARSWFGASTEVYANGGSMASSVTANNTAGSGGSSGLAITGLPKTVVSSFGSNVTITASRSGGSGGAGYRNILSVETGGGGGGGAGKTVTGTSGSTGTGLMGGDGAAASADGLGGSGGSGSGNCVINAGNGSSGGGGGGGRTSCNNAVAGKGGDGRVWVEFVYEWFGAMPQKPLLDDLNSRCILTSNLSVPLNVTNPEQDVEYQWRRGTSPTPSDNDVCVGSGTSYTVTSPGYYYCFARYLDPDSPNFNATDIAPYCGQGLGSPAVFSDVVWFGTEPQIDDASTTLSTCNSYTPALTGIKTSRVVYTWDVPTNASFVKGATSGKNQTSFTTGTLVNGTNDPLTLVYTVTPSDSLSGVKCVGADFTVSVTIDPAAKIYTIASTALFIPPLASPNNTITINLRDYVTSYEGTLAFYKNTTANYYDSIPNSDQIVLSPCDTTIYARAYSSASCISDPWPLNFIVKESVQADVHWDSNNQIHYGCSVVDLTKIIYNIYPSNAVVEFLDSNEVLIDDPTEVIISGSPSIKNFTLRLKHPTSGYIGDFPFQITYNSSFPVALAGLSYNYMCPLTLKANKVDLSEMITIQGGVVYNFYSDYNRTDKLFTWNPKTGEGLPIVYLDSHLSNQTAYYFYVEKEDMEGCIGSLTNLEIYVNSIPNAVLMDPVTHCNTTVTGFILDNTIVSLGSSTYTSGYYSSTDGGLTKQFIANNLAVVDITVGTSYYVKLRNYSGCELDVLLPIDAVVTPTLTTRPVSVWTGNNIADLTQAVEVLTPVTANVKYYSKQGENYTLINNPKSITILTDTTFYAQAVNGIAGTCIGNSILPFEVRHISSPVVRDTAFCSSSSSTVSVNLGNLVQLPSNYVPYYDQNSNYYSYCDTVKVYRDAAGSELLTSNYSYQFSFYDYLANGQIKDYWIQICSNKIKTPLQKFTVARNPAPNIAISVNTINVNRYQPVDLMTYVTTLAPEFTRDEISLLLKIDYDKYIADGRNFDPNRVYMNTASTGYTDVPGYSIPTGQYYSSIYPYVDGKPNALSPSEEMSGACIGTIWSGYINIVDVCPTMTIPSTVTDVCGGMLVSDFISYPADYGILSFERFDGNWVTTEDKIPNQIGTIQYRVTFTPNVVGCSPIQEEISIEVTHVGVDIQSQNLTICDPTTLTNDLDLKTAILNSSVISDTANWRFYFKKAGVETEYPNGILPATPTADFFLHQIIYFEYTNIEGCVYTLPIEVRIGTQSLYPINTPIIVDGGTISPNADGVERAQFKVGDVINFEKFVRGLSSTNNLVVRFASLGDLLANADLIENAVVSNPLAYTVPHTAAQLFSIRERYDSGCESNPVLAIVVSTGSTYIWQPGLGDTEMSDVDLRDWNNEKNWGNYTLSGVVSNAGIPNSNTEVIIPAINHDGTAINHFPDLTSINDAVCKDIYFAQGAELTRPDKLTYQRAYVSLNFGLESKMQATADIGSIEAIADAICKLNGLASMAGGNVLSRNQWHLLSAPLGDMVTGDYSFGGFPAAYLRKFSASAATTGTALVGNWSKYFTSSTADLIPGEGFALWMNNYRDQASFREAGSGIDSPINTGTREYGLAKSNGLLIFPYYDTKDWSDAHRIHVFEEVTNTSRFYGVDDLEISLPLLSNYTTKTRTAAANRFVFEQAAETPNVSYPVTAGDVVWANDTHHFALIGNPYLSSIDFDQFYADNSASIKNGFYLFAGDEYKTYSPGGSDLNRYIAPMQSFLVEMQESVQTANLNFQVANISIPRNDVSFLRSSQQPIDQLKITLSNENGSSNTYLATRAYGSETVNQYDLSKLLSSVKSSPEIYTLKSMKQDGMRQSAIANNIISIDNALIPLGMITSWQGNMNFTLTGMDNYNAQIMFMDALLDVEEDISGQTEFNYNFSYSPNKDNKGQVLANENRFFLRISNVPTGMNNNAGRITVYNMNHAICILSSSNDPIKSILITDLQGRTLYRNDSVNEVYTQVRKSNELPSICVVQVVTERSSQTQKLITK